MKIFNKIVRFIYGDTSLISPEGWEILQDPVKRVRLREMIDHYHKVGVWDFTIMEGNSMCKELHNKLEGIGLTREQTIKVMDVINHLPIHIKEGVNNTKVCITDGIVVVEKHI